MKLCNNNECTGCSACVSACPQNALELKKDSKGFLRPVIDTEKCIGCEICTNVCQKLLRHMMKDNHKSSFYLAYAAKLKDEQKRMQSQSGGLFTALAETILEKGGIVYGAGFDGNNHIKHFRITELDELNKLKGSKYVQSDINNCFQRIISDLNEGKAVLFSGTPCQVAGIESLLDFKKIDISNFYSCDLICHGVPSPAIYELYISWLESINNASITYFNFRDKMVNGWKNHLETYRFSLPEFLCDENKKVVSNIYSDLFYSNLTLGEACEKCKYASRNRPGDLTMADCWGIEKIKPDLWNDNKGISVCLIQTKKGEYLFDMAKNKMDCFMINAEDYSQPNLAHATSVPCQKIRFWNDFSKMPFDKLLKKYTVHGGIRFKIKRKILKKLKKW